ncbi:MAG: hypothetical protein PUP92_11395 [Rhizonema sp. PD38]|nr:hypothetical protein [Rhizonema sp. PD38]
MDFTSVADLTSWLEGHL